MMQAVSKHQLFVKCALASLVVHSAVVYLVLSSPWSPHVKAFFGRSTAPKIDLKEDSTFLNQVALEHFFEEISVVKQVEIPPALFHPLEEEAHRLAISSTNPKLLSTQVVNLDPKPLILSKQTQAPLLKKPLFSPLSLPATPYAPSEMRLSLLTIEVPKLEPWEPTMISMVLKTTLPSEESLLVNLQATFPSFEKLPISNAQRGFLTFQEASVDFNLISFRMTLPLEFPFELKAEPIDLDSYLPEQLVATTQWNDFFEITPHASPSDEKYIFSLTIVPKKEMQIERIPQNFYFLIDGSASIEKHKFTVFKKAVLKGLSQLQSGDCFNVIVLGKSITRLSNGLLSYSPKSVQMAEHFLENLAEKSFFPSSSLYDNLQKVLSMIEQTGDAQTAIFLSNGKSTPLEAKPLKNFLNKNGHRICLHTAAVGQGNLLMPLDALSSLTGGNLLYSDTNAAFPRKFAEFIKTLQAPIAQEVTVSLEPCHNRTTLALSHSFISPRIHLGQPFIVMGTMDRLSKLHLVFHGLHGEEFVAVDQTISFEEVSSLSHGLQKQWARQCAQSIYKTFLDKEKPALLEKAKQHLRTFYGKVVEE